MATSIINANIHPQHPDQTNLEESTINNAHIIHRQKMPETDIATQEALRLHEQTEEAE